MIIALNYCGEQQGKVFNVQVKRIYDDKSTFIHGKYCYLECGYNCHVACSDMVIQCRPTRRLSPDSLSVTDSEAESVSKYSVHSHRASFDRYLDDNKSTHSNSSRKHPKMLEDLPRTSSSSKLLDESVLKSPTFSTGSTSGPPPNNDLRSKASLNKAYRKSLKQKLQQHSNGNGHSNDITMSPHATAKAFTRLVARSKAFFYIGKSIHDIYSWKNNAYSLLVCLFWVCSCKMVYFDRRENESYSICYRPEFFYRVTYTTPADMFTLHSNWCH